MRCLVVTSMLCLILTGCVTDPNYNPRSMKNMTADELVKALKERL